MAWWRTGLAAVAFSATAAAPAAKPLPLPPPTGELHLDLADPVITVVIADVPLRLRVGLDQRDVVELNRAAVARLPLIFEAGPTDAVGRVGVASVVAGATFAMNGRPVPVTLSSHGECCAGVDGAISPALLPYAAIRFVRAAAPAGESRRFTMTHDGDYGLEVRQPPLRLIFSFDRPETLATAAAGAMLAKAQGGRFEGGYAPVPVAFGIARPSRMIAFARPALLAGFRFDRLRTRTADFAGRNRLPADPREPGEILVSRRKAPQHAWPAVTFGRDRLDRCTEILFRPATLELMLTCTFDG